MQQRFCRRMKGRAKSDCTNYFSDNSLKIWSKKYQYSNRVYFKCFHGMLRNYYRSRNFVDLPPNKPKKFHFDLQTVSRLEARGVGTRLRSTKIRLVLRPHSLTRKGVWWSLSDSLVVSSQHSWYWTTKWNSITSTNRSICSLVPRPHPPFCNANEVKWLLAFC